MQTIEPTIEHLRLEKSQLILRLEQVDITLAKFKKFSEKSITMMPHKATLQVIRRYLDSRFHDHSNTIKVSMTKAMDRNYINETNSLDGKTTILYCGGWPIYSGTVNYLERYYNALIEKNDTEYKLNKVRSNIRQIYQNN